MNGDSEGGFEWDEVKRAHNVATLDIDFEDAIAIWQGVVLQRRSDRRGEERYTAFGIMSGRVIAVVWTPRGDRRRIISARVARRHERKDYAAFAGSASDRSN